MSSPGYNIRRVAAARFTFDALATKSVTLAASGAVMGMVGVAFDEGALLDLALASFVVAVTPLVTIVAMLWTSKP